MAYAVAALVGALTCAAVRVICLRLAHAWGGAEDARRRIADDLRRDVVALKHALKTEFARREGPYR